MSGPHDRSRLALRDQLAESVHLLREQPWRALGSSVAVVLGVGAAIATIVLAQTARHQVSAEFDALRATQVNVVPAEAGPAGTGAPAGSFPPDASARLGRLSGTVAAGVITVVAPEVPVRSSTLADGAGTNATTGEVIALGPGALHAAEPEITGTPWGRWAERDGLRVTLLGRVLADALGLRQVDPGQVVVVDGVPFALGGIVTDGAREPRLLRAALVPATTAALVWPGRVGEPPHALVRVAPGAAAAVAAQAPVALRPDKPQSFTALAPPDPASLRQRVESDVEALFLVTAAIALVVGAIGIGASTMVSVMERRTELALRRTLGARPGHLLRHVLTDTALLGTASGLAGTVAAIAVSLVVAAVQGWVPIVDLRLVVLGPVLGAVVGALAGLPAARRASRAEPAAAIRA